MARVSFLPDDGHDGDADDVQEPDHEQQADDGRQEPAPLRDLAELHAVHDYHADLRAAPLRPGPGAPGEAHAAAHEEGHGGVEVPALLQRHDEGPPGPLEAAGEGDGRRADEEEFDEQDEADDEDGCRNGY